MATAKVFRSGNSQAVRLPRELRLEASEVEIIRRGDTLIMRPIQPHASLARAFDALADIQGDFFEGGREQGEMPEREAF